MDEASAIIRALLADEPTARARAKAWLDASERQQQLRAISARVREAIEAKLLTFVPTEPPATNVNHTDWPKERQTFVWRQLEYLGWRINGAKVEIVSKPYDPLNRPPILLGVFSGREAEILPALAAAATTALVRELRKYEGKK